MDKMELLQNINFVVNELTDSIKNQCIMEEEVKNQNVRELEKYVSKYIEQETSEFNSGYSISRLNTIIKLLLNIIKEQDKRISKLENKF